MRWVSMHGFAACNTGNDVRPCLGGYPYSLMALLVHNLQKSKALGTLGSIMTRLLPADARLIPKRKFCVWLAFVKHATM